MPGDPKGEEIPAGDPVPSVTLTMAGRDGAAWRFDVATDVNLTLSTGPYRPMLGHLHVYVDGVEKQMLAEKRFTLKDLTPGTHAIRVTIAATDHRNLLHDGHLVGASLDLLVPASER
jgi:periplasmic copper chaperone A